MGIGWTPGKLPSRRPPGLVHECGYVREACVGRVWESAPFRTKIFDDGGKLGNSTSED